MLSCLNRAVPLYVCHRHESGIENVCGHGRDGDGYVSSGEFEDFVNVVLVEVTSREKNTKEENLS